MIRFIFVQAAAKAGHAAPAAKPAAAAPVQEPAPPAEKKTYAECRLQVNTQGGKRLMVLTTTCKPVFCSGDLYSEQVLFIDLQTYSRNLYDWIITGVMRWIPKHCIIMSELVYALQAEWPIKLSIPSSNR